MINNNKTIKQYSNIEKTVGILMLLFAVSFNLWLYRLESTVTTDPNDNTFQFALVDRTNQIWDFAYKNCPKNLSLITCHLSLLVDHWVPNWTEGYNLPFYYSHIPQILIVGSWRIFDGFIGQIGSISLFQYYHWIIYLLLSLFPLTVFLSLRLIRLPFLTAGIGALLATHLSTDGLYGLDPSSFLWRGYGLSSQLFAMIWLPLAIAYSWKYLTSNKQEAISKKLTMRSYLLSLISYRLLLPVFFLIATTMGHLGIGMIALLSLIPLAFGQPIILFLQQCNPAKRDLASPDNVAIEQLKKNIVKLTTLVIVTIFFLSYWIIPIFLNDNYHNISFWDPVWKFNSYGWKETLVRLFNGDLFDFGRFPVLTILAFFGIFKVIGGSDKIFEDRFPSLVIKTKRDNDLTSIDNQKDDPEDASSGARKFSSRTDMAGFGFLFLFWLLLYFGRTTWGGLIDLIPGMKEFHLSRFIVGLHVAGMFLAPIGIGLLIEHTTFVFLRIFKQFNNRTIEQLLYCCIAILLSGIIAMPIYKQTISYASYNDVLIRKGNADARLVQKDVDELFTTLKQLPPGRIFAGRGGSWGRNFKVADTPYYMLLSTYGIPTVLWLPETWSPNADTEQYFSDDQEKDYALYNIRYVVTPSREAGSGFARQPFWKLIKETPTWKLYEVTPTGDADTVHKGLTLLERVRPSRIHEGYFTSGVRPVIVSSDKRSFVNLIHLWIQSSDTHAKGLYPELTFAKDFPQSTGLPNFRMIDEITYKVPDGSIHNIFAEPPLYLPVGYQSKDQLEKATIEQYSNITIEKEESEADMVFKTRVTVGSNCTECLVILKQTYHPNWKATIDGKPVSPITVFPFYLAVPITKGVHDIVFTYEPSKLKVALLMVELIGLAVIVGMLGKKTKNT